MPKVVTLEDAGLFGMVCHNFGIGHPPGYPIYTFACSLFANLPWLSPILGLNLLSAFCASSTVTLVMLLVIQITKNEKAIVFGWLAGGLVGLGSTLFSQAIIAEVYTLHTLMIFVLLLFLIQWFQYSGETEIDNKRAEKLLLRISVWTGLCLATHWPLTVLMLPATLPLLFWHFRSVKVICRREFVLRFFVWGFIALFIPYFILWWRSIGYFDISFYGPLDTWQRYWIYLSRSGYAGVDGSGKGLYQWDYLLWLFKQGQLQFSAPIFGASVVALIASYWFLPLALALSFTWILLSSTVVLNMLLGFSFEPTFQAVFQVYPIISWSILPLVYTVVLYKIFQRFNVSLVGVLAQFLLIIHLSYVLSLNVPQHFRHNDSWAYRQALAILQSFEPNSDVFIYDDSHLPLMYLHQVHKVRPDVRIYNSQSLIKGNRLYDIDTPIAFRKSIIAYHVAHSGRVTHHLSDIEVAGYQSNSNGQYFTLSKQAQPIKPNVELEHQLLQLYLRYIDSGKKNYWTRTKMESSIGRVLFEQLKIENYDLEAAEQRAEILLYNNSQSYLGNHLKGITLVLKQNYEVAIPYLYLCLQIQPTTIDALVNLVNTLLYLERRDEALHVLKQSQSRYPNPKKQEMLKQVFKNQFLKNDGV